jgi:hypothetical protein
MKAYGFGGIALLVLNLRLWNRGEWSFDTAIAVPQIQKDAYPLIMRLRGHQRRCGIFWYVRNLLLLTETEQQFIGHTAYSSVTVLIAVSWLTIPVITIQAMHVWRNNDAPSCSHCCSGKALNITQPKCLFVALGIQHAMRMRLIAICGLSGSTIFFQIIS